MFKSIVDLWGSKRGVVIKKEVGLTKHDETNRTWACEETSDFQLKF